MMTYIKQDGVFKPKKRIKPKKRQSSGFTPDDWSIAVSVSGVPGEYEREEIIRAVCATICRLNSEKAENAINYKITVRETED